MHRSTYAQVRRNESERKRIRQKEKEIKLEKHLLEYQFSILYMIELAVNFVTVCILTKRFFCFNEL